MSEEAGSIGAAEVAEVAGDDAQGREFTGILDVERIAGGKRLQATTLECDDGETYILSYRPMLDHLDKIERRVIVRGETYAPEGQAVGGRHLRARSRSTRPTSTLPPSARKPRPRSTAPCRSAYSFVLWMLVRREPRRAATTPTETL